MTGGVKTGLRLSLAPTIAVGNDTEPGPDDPGIDDEPAIGGALCMYDDWPVPTPAMPPGPLGTACGLVGSEWLDDPCTANVDCVGLPGYNETGGGRCPPGRAGKSG